jgi:hypothetical protein
MTGRALRLGLTLGVLAATVASKSSALVGADLNIAPKRVVFDAASRSATIYVFNQGAEPATYLLDLVDEVMTPDGRIEPVEEAKLNAADAGLVGKLQSAKPLATFTPHRVTLAGGESQAVRIRISRPADLAVGEYRTHLVVTAAPPKDAGLTADQVAAGDAAKGVSVRVIGLFSLSIPVIVRQGAADARAGIDATELSLPSGSKTSAEPPSLSLDIVRKGASSLYGDLEVRVLKGDKPAEVLGQIKGLGVYPEVDRRRVRVALSRAPQPGERLAVTYKDDDAQPGATLATAVIAAP